MQTTGTTAQQLAEQMAKWLLASMKHSQGHVFEIVAELELTMTQLKILHILDGSGRELTPSELAQFIGLSPAATGRAVDALTRSGLVSRREDEADRRVKRLALTPQGAETVERISQARIDGLAQYLERLDPGQRDALAAALAPLVPDSSSIPDGCAATPPRTEDDQ